MEDAKSEVSSHTENPNVLHWFSLVITQMLDSDKHMSDMSPETLIRNLLKKSSHKIWALNSTRVLNTISMLITEEWVNIPNLWKSFTI